MEGKQIAMSKRLTCRYCGKRHKYTHIVPNLAAYFLYAHPSQLDHFEVDFTSAPLDEDEEAMRLLQKHLADWRAFDTTRKLDESELL